MLVKWNTENLNENVCPCISLLYTKKLGVNALAFEVTACHTFGPALRIYRTRWVTAELQGVILSLWSIMNLRMWYIRRKDTRIFTVVYCIRMLQLSFRLIRQYRKHNFPFMCSSGLCVQNILQNNVAVQGGGREFRIRRRDTCVAIQAKRQYGKVQWMIHG